MKKTNKTLAAAALAGLLGGGFASVASAASTQSGHQPAYGSAGVVADTPAGDTHDCKGHNSCKGKGGCKSGDNGCASKNSCKGKGGCAMKDGKPAHS